MFFDLFIDKIISKKKSIILLWVRDLLVIRRETPDYIPSITSMKYFTGSMFLKNCQELIISINSRKNKAKQKTFSRHIFSKLQPSVSHAARAPPSSTQSGGPSTVRGGHSTKTGLDLAGPCRNFLHAVLASGAVTVAIFVQKLWTFSPSKLPKYNLILLEYPT